jgi:hypothetical protein
MLGGRQGDAHALQARGGLLRSHCDVFSPEAIAAFAARLHGARREGRSWRTASSAGPFPRGGRSSRRQP